MQHERDELVARHAVLARPEVLPLHLAHRRVVRENGDLLLGVERRDFQLGLVRRPRGNEADVWHHNDGT